MTYTRTIHHPIIVRNNSNTQNKYTHIRASGTHRHIHAHLLAQCRCMPVCLWLLCMCGWELTNLHTPERKHPTCDSPDIPEMSVWWRCLWFCIRRCRSPRQLFRRSPRLCWGRHGRVTWVQGTAPLDQEGFTYVLENKLTIIAGVY